MFCVFVRVYIASASGLLDDDEYLLEGERKEGMGIKCRGEWRMNVKANKENENGSGGSKGLYMHFFPVRAKHEKLHWWVF